MGTARLAGGEAPVSTHGIWTAVVNPEFGDFRVFARLHLGEFVAPRDEELSAVPQRRPGGLGIRVDADQRELLGLHSGRGLDQAGSISLYVARLRHGMAQSDRLPP